MFDQTFTGTQQTRTPATLALSLLMQAAALCILISIPLIYTQTIGMAQLRNMIVAPTPPVQAATAHPPARTQARSAFHAFVAPQLVAPARVPTGIHAIQDAPTPEIGPATGDQAMPGVAIDGLVGHIAQALPPPPPVQKPKPPGPLRVGGNVAAANLIRSVQPVYPALAKAARVHGTVEFTAIISKDGNIENLMLVHGHPLLVNAAREAVLQWKYRPTLLNGQPVEVVTDIVVNFMLSE